MYITVSTERISESGKNVTLYGIKSENTYYPDLTSKREKAERLCELCNRLGVSEEQIIYIIEDFINSKAGLSAELSGR